MRPVYVSSLGCSCVFTLRPPPSFCLLLLLLHICVKTLFFFLNDHKSGCNLAGCEAHAVIVQPPQHTLLHSTCACLPTGCLQQQSCRARPIQQKIFQLGSLMLNLQGCYCCLVSFAHCYFAVATKNKEGVLGGVGRCLHSPAWLMCRRLQAEGQDKGTD